MADLNEVQLAVLADIEARRIGYVKQDDYARQRCACDHLVYDGDVPGGACRFCDCTDHTAPGQVQT